MTDYITPEGFKQRHGITTSTNDFRIPGHCTAASLEADSMCGRHFGQVFDLVDDVETATVRYFHADTNWRVRIDDCYDLDEVALDLTDSGTYGTVLAATDYTTQPTNGVGPNGQAGFPATQIVMTGSYSLPRCRRPGVKVTGKWGWSAVPTDVIEATYLIAHRLYYEVSVPGGVTPPNVEFGLPGSPLQRPYTVERLLAPYVRADRKLGIA